VRRRLGPRLTVPLLALLLLCPSPEAPAQEAGAGSLQEAEAGGGQESAAEPGETVYFEGVSLFPCLVLVPDDYDESKSYPLVVGLHGHGGRADDFFLPAPWFASAGVIFAVPQAPYAFPSAGRIGYSWDLRGFDDEAGEQWSDALTERYVLDIVDALSERYNVEDVYLMGFSQGGGVTYRTAIKNHALFAGLIAYGSWFDAEWYSAGELEEAGDLRVFISQGGDDGAAPAAAMARDMLQDLGYEVEFFEFEGGHIITRPAIEALLRWLQR